MTDETLFAAALENPDRAAVLASCPDPEQRQRVERLLAAHDRASGFLKQPAAPPRTAFETRDHVPEDQDLDDSLGFLTPSTRPEALGRIGHYEVLEVLGRGGFGIVFRAFDEVLQRVVAVKVLAPSMAATSPARKRFLREARSSAAIRHENVVLVHAVEEQPLPHIVMEFVPGESLQQRLDRAGPLDPLEVLRIGRQVAEGLAAAHATGVVHRDIKPANILVEPGTHRARITDFGLARAADDASLTRSGTVAGTPLYMAPEQAKGESLDHRADLFSLGSVLYAILTGRPPFRAESTLGVLKRVADDTPRPIREVIPEVPEWFCRIIEKLHAKNPADRYQTAREVAGVLADCERQLAAHKELKDTSRIPAAPPRRRRRSRRRVWVAAAVVVLAGAFVWFGRPAMLYANNQGELQLLPGEGLVSVIVLHNDEGVLDGNKLHAPATDWLGMKEKSHTLKLSPGRYQLNVGTWPEGTAVSQWELTTSSLFGRSQVSVPVINTSAIITVERGQRVTLRPKMRHAPSPPPSPPAPPPPTTPANDGFVALFNGKDLTGWQEFPAGRGSWKVENGVLVGSGKPSHLFTRANFGSFHLRMETRIKSVPKGGAVGVFARVALEDPGTILSPFGKGGLYRIPVPKLYDDKAAPPDPGPPNYRDEPLVVWGTDLKGEKTNVKAFPTDQWFKHEFILDDKNMSIRTDAGTNSSSSFIFAGAAAGSGHIALQLFDDWSTVEFRKIEIKELSPTPLAVPTKAADVLPFLAGSWKAEWEEFDPKLTPDKASGVGHVTYDFVAGGTVLRTRSAVGRRREEAVLLHTYDPGKNAIQVWQARSTTGHTTGPTAGAFNPDSRSLTWTYQNSGNKPSNHQFTFVDGNTVTIQLSHMDANSNLVRVASMKLTRMSGPAALAELPADPQRPDEMKVLDRLIGEWRTELTIRNTANLPKTQTQRVSAAAVLGGRFVEVIATDEGANRGDFTLAWFDAAKKQYRRWLFGSTGQFSEFTGTWDEAAKALSWVSSDGRLEARWTFKSDNLREYHRLSKDAAGKTLSSAEGVSRRVETGKPAPVLLKRFDPAKDKPTLPWGDPKNVTVEDGGWRIENNTNKGNFRALFGTLLDDIPTDGVIVFRAKVKVKANDKLTWGDLQLGVGGPNFYGYDWPEHLGTYRGDVPEWTEKEMRYPASAFHQKNPPSISVYVGLYSNGVVWVKDAEVLHIPAKPGAAPNPAVLQPLRDRVASVTKTLDLTNKRFEAGNVSKIEVLRAEADLLAARIALAEAEGDAAAVLARLDELVKACQEERNLIEKRVTAGIDRADVLNQADARLAEAKVRLAKAKPAKP